MPVELLYLWGYSLAIGGLLIVCARRLRRLRNEGRLWRWEGVKRVVFAKRAKRETHQFWLLVALIYVGFGVFLLAQRETIFGPLSWAEAWNKRFYFELLNPNNTAASVIFMAVGGVIFAWKGLYEPWFKETSLPTWRTVSPLVRQHGLRRYWITAVLLLVVMSWRLLEQDTSFFPVFVWLLVIGIVSWLIWRWEKGGDIDLSPHLTRLDGVWIVTLLLVGFSIGSAYLLEIPAKMVGDEGSFWETARKIAVGDYRPSFFGLGVYTFPIASSFFQSFILRVFGITIWSWRFASVVAGVLGTIPLYLLTKEWFERRTAVVATFIMLVTPYFIAFARMGYNNSQALFPVICCLYFMTLALKRSSYFYTWLAGLAAAAGFFTYPAAQLGLVVLVLMVCYLAATSRLSRKDLIRIGGIVVFAWLLIRFPKFVYSAAIPDGATPYKMWESMFFNVFFGRAFYTDAELFHLTGPIQIGTQEIFYEPAIYLQLLMRGILRSLLVFLAPLGRIGEHFLEAGLAGGLTASVFLVFGSGLAVRGWRRLRFALLLIWFGSGIFLLSVANSFPPRHAHMVTVMPAMAILIAIGLISFTETFVTAMVSIFHKGKPDRLIWLIIVVVVITISYAGMTNYFGKVAEKYPSDFDQAVTWTAVRFGQQEDISIVEVETETRNHGILYLLWAEALTLDYRILKAADINEGTAVLPDSKNLMVFVPHEVESKLLGEIVEQMESGTEPVPLGKEWQTPWGYVLTNRDIDIMPRLTLSGALYSLIGLPVSPVLIVLFLLLVILLRPYSRLFIQGKKGRRKNEQPPIPKP